MTTRYEAIMQVVEGDRFWPPTSTAKLQFVASICEVLARLPEEEFGFVENQLGFVLEDPVVDALAANVPIPDVAEFGSPKGANEAACLIVFFCGSWKLSQKALVGLIAHELAHSFVGGANYEHDEALTDEKARS